MVKFEGVTFAAAPSVAAVQAAAARERRTSCGERRTSCGGGDAPKVTSLVLVSMVRREGEAGLGLGLTRDNAVNRVKPGGPAEKAGVA